MIVRRVEGILMFMVCLLTSCKTGSFSHTSGMLKAGELCVLGLQSGPVARYIGSCLKIETDGPISIYNTF